MVLCVLPIEPSSLLLLGGLGFGVWGLGFRVEVYQVAKGLGRRGFYELYADVREKSHVYCVFLKALFS